MNFFLECLYSGKDYERHRLLRWRDPKKELPDFDVPALAKLEDDRYVVVYYKSNHWTDHMGYTRAIKCWRPIVEL